jgi:hypothetical protein
MWKSLSFANFFLVIGMPVYLLVSNLRATRKNEIFFGYPHILLSPFFPPPLVLITACKLSYGVLSPLNRLSI